MYYIGVDLGGTNIAVGIVDSNFKILLKGSIPTQAGRPGEEIVKDMTELAKSLMNKLGLTVDDIAYAGIASPGHVNSDTGIVEYSNNLRFREFPIAKIFKSYLPVKEVYVENDANAAALGETLASGLNLKNTVMITLGTGLGGGVVINGRLYSGFNHAGAELGHTVIQYNGRQCTCGRRGCFEAYCSATALTALTKEKITECKIKGIPTLLITNSERDGKINARTAFDAMKSGDKIAKEVIDEYISYLACGVSNLINIFQPEALLIGGGVCNEGDNLLIPLKEIVNREQYTRNSIREKQTKIMIAKLGNDAGIVGAAALGM